MVGSLWRGAVVGGHARGECLAAVIVLSAAPKRGEWEVNGGQLLHHVRLPHAAEPANFRVHLIG